MTLPRYHAVIRNPENGREVSLEMGLDYGSDLSNVPVALASNLGLALSTSATVGTVGGDVGSFVERVEILFKGARMPTYMVFRMNDFEPILGSEPMKRFFEITMVGDTVDIKLRRNPDPEPPLSKFGLDRVRRINRP